MGMCVVGLGLLGLVTLYLVYGGWGVMPEDLTNLVTKVTGFSIDYAKCMFCALCVEPCPVDCIFMGASLDLSCYSRDGCLVDFARLPVDIAWGRAALNPTAVSESKVIAEPVHGGPNQ